MKGLKVVRRVNSLRYFLRGPLEAKLAATDPNALIADYDYLATTRICA